MNLNEAILLLENLRKKHDGNTELFFDCPFCLKSYAPNKIVALSIHVKADKEKE